MKTSLVRPFIEKFLQGYLEIDELVQPDEDGDYGFRSGTAEVLVTFIEEQPAIVTVLSMLLRGVKKSPKLLEALNDTNGEWPFAKVYWREDGVVLRLDLLAESLDEVQMRTACDLVSDLADHLDTLLKEKFHGDLAYAEPEGET
ncbi:MAG TPA: YbjN domain-containing protein [Vicinamibacterales bacterium]|nr:YbjN domain-containing protein [Vicinamibacterales bacterium]